MVGGLIAKGAYDKDTANRQVGVNDKGSSSISMGWAAAISGQEGRPDRHDCDAAIHHAATTPVAVFWWPDALHLHLGLTSVDAFLSAVGLIIIHDAAIGCWPKCLSRDGIQQVESVQTWHLQWPANDGDGMSTMIVPSHLVGSQLVDVFLALGLVEAVFEVGQCPIYVIIVMPFVHCVLCPCT